MGVPVTLGFVFFFVPALPSATYGRPVTPPASPLPDAAWCWVHEHVKGDVQLGSDSGGTDSCSGFLGSNPLEPVHLGELQGPLLGVAVESWSDTGQRLIGGGFKFSNGDL